MVCVACDSLCYSIISRERKLNKRLSTCWKSAFNCVLSILLVYVSHSISTELRHATIDWLLFTTILTGISSFVTLSLVTLTIFMSRNGSGESVINGKNVRALAENHYASSSEAYCQLENWDELIRLQLEYAALYEFQLKRKYYF